VKETTNAQVTELIRSEAVDETDWSLEMLQKLNPAKYRQKGFIPLREVVVNCVTLTEQHQILWPENIFCSMNFFQTVKKGPNSLNYNLRPIDSVLWINSDLILISEREAEMLLLSMRGNLSKSQNVIRITHFSLLKSHQGESLSEVPLSLCLGSENINRYDQIDDLVIVALQIFQGEPMYGHRLHRVRELFLNFDQGKQCAKEFVAMRGNGHLYEKSDLDLMSQREDARIVPAPAMVPTRSRKSRRRTEGGPAPVAATVFAVEEEEIEYLRPVKQRKKIIIDLVDIETP
jgi:hypothetical protein